MFLTIEEMNEIKNNYLAEISALEAKVAVVNDFIAMAESKGDVKSEEVVEEAEPETAQPEQAQIY